MRRAFTLVELLVVMTIIAMLAAMSLGAVYAARETARKEKTKATIAKLDTIIQAKYSEIIMRRMPIKNRRIPPDAMAELRFRVLHEVMRMEMPDRVRDIVFPVDPLSNPLYPVPSTAGPLDVETAMKPADGDLGKVHPVACYTIVDPSLSPPENRDYRYWLDMDGNRKYGRTIPNETTMDLPGITRTATARRIWRQLYNGKDRFDPQFDSAECLYMIIQSDPEAREQFREDEVGDADGDGFMEFHDGWDRPIMWLRWAPAFHQQSDLMSGDPSADPDPMNDRKIGDLEQDPPGSGKWIRPGCATYRLVPLIYSGGPDKKYGIYAGDNWVAQFQPGDPLTKVWLNTDIGKPDDTSSEERGAYTDNITNQSMVQ